MLNGEKGVMILKEAVIAVSNYPDICLERLRKITKSVG
jgi:hypothetical protein